MGAPSCSAASTPRLKRSIAALVSANGARSNAMIDAGRRSESARRLLMSFGEVRLTASRWFRSISIPAKRAAPHAEIISSNGLSRPAVIVLKQGFIFLFLRAVHELLINGFEDSHV